MTSDFHQYCISKSITQDIDDLQATPTSTPCILHFNVRGLTSKVEDVKELLCNLSEKGFKPLCILLCETFLNVHNAKLCNIEGFKLVRNDRNAHGGGVAIYVDDEFNFNLCDNLTYNDSNEFECIFIELFFKGRTHTNTHTHKLLIGEIYRTPNSNLIKSHDRFDALFKKIPRSYQQVIIGTDQNIDYLKLHTKNHSDFLHMVISHGYTPCINQPTRVTTTTATLIDNIYTKGIVPTESHVFTSHTSDHYPIMINFDTPPPHSFKNSVSFQSRKFTADANSNIETDLITHNWHSLHSMDTNTAFTHFMNILSQSIDTHAPLRTVTINKKHLRREPWFTKALQTSSKKLRHLYKQFISTTSPQAHARYTQYRNMYNKIRKAAKNMHFSKLFNEYKNDIKKTWNLIHSLTGNTKNSNTITALNLNNTIITHPQDIVEAFASHFATVSTRTLTQPFHTQDHAHITPSNSTFFLRPTTHTEIFATINSLKPKKSAGHDSINTQFIKKIKFSIIDPLEIIINKSFTEGQFPSHLKIAKVIPIHKSKQKNLTVNYRPISILPAISKIFEKLLTNRLIQFFQNHSTLTDNQFGFRKKHSTIHAVTKFTLDIITDITENKSTLATFIDFSKAFDKIDHQILLHKLSLYGIRGIGHQIISSYLNNRQFYVSHNQHTSQHITTHDIGVPQGSILGPLLFLIYINDLPTYLSDSKLILFADDTTIYQSHENTQILHSTMNTCLNKLNAWCKFNRIEINLSKTKYMIFNGKKSQNAQAIHINHTPIEQVPFFKFLGITIDEKLKWSEHTKSVKIKLAQGLHALNSIQNKSNTNIRKMIYNSLVHSHLTYGTLIWGNTYKKYTNPIFTAQKKALRKIENAPSNSHTAPLFIKHKILTLEQIYKHQTIILMHSFHHSILPNSLMSFFNRFVPAHTNTRFAHLIRPPRTNLQLAHQSTLYTGPQLYSTIFHHVNTEQNPKIFKKALKMYILTT